MGSFSFAADAASGHPPPSRGLVGRLAGGFVVWFAQRRQLEACVVFVGRAIAICHHLLEEAV